MPGTVETMTGGFRYPASVEAAAGVSLLLETTDAPMSETLPDTAVAIAITGRTRRRPWSAYCLYSVSDCPAVKKRDHRLSRPGVRALRGSRGGICGSRITYLLWADLESHVHITTTVRRRFWLIAG